MLIVAEPSLPGQGSSATPGGPIPAPMQPATAHRCKWSASSSISGEPFLGAEGIIAFPSFRRTRSQGAVEEAKAAFCGQMDLMTEEANTTKLHVLASLGSVPTGATSSWEAQWLAWTSWKHRTDHGSYVSRAPTSAMYVERMLTKTRRAGAVPADPAHSP